MEDTEEPMQACDAACDAAENTLAEAQDLLDLRLHGPQATHSELASALLQVALSPETALSVLTAVDVYNSVVPPPTASDSNDSLTPFGQYWKVWGNDPIDGSGGGRSVLTAQHSSGKPEMFVCKAFPSWSADQCASWIRGMPGANVWRAKAGGLKDECIADARIAAREIIKAGMEHGPNLRVWGCGMGMDRMVQCSTKTGWFQAENMRPAAFSLTPAHWQEIGIRASPTMNKDGRCCSINLDSSSDGTATYQVEIYDKGVFKTHFFLGVFPHPGSTGWGQAKCNLQAASKFLRNLAAGTPEQTHVIKFEADEYGAT